ncbi:MAG TPA: hypothetical protein VKE41_03470 [Roseiflexaceae bacterium]|nr:hypothetical protein [Roseiflexaceae bacterium]
MSDRNEIWDLWFPDAAAQGLPFARGLLRATDVLLVHAAPASLRVDVVDDAGNLLARADRLLRTAETPVAWLTRRAGRIEREDIWPSAAGRAASGSGRRRSGYFDSPVERSGATGMALEHRAVQSQVTDEGPKTDPGKCVSLVSSLLSLVIGRRLAEAR